jgi:hypothetical protein
MVKKAAALANGESTSFILAVEPGIQPYRCSSLVHAELVPNLQANQRGHGT